MKRLVYLALAGALLAACASRDPFAGTDFSDAKPVKKLRPIDPNNPPPSFPPIPNLPPEISQPY